jgi:ubiquinone/menaquinone biosynthesis C-methylase UbiE
MNPYERYVLPYVIDAVCGLPTFKDERRRLVPRAQGRVLEIGVGTGRNLPHYAAGRVSCVCGVDPGLHPKAIRRARAQGIQLEALPLSAERIPVEDHSFDCVVCTFSLCTIPDPVAALDEMRRALKPGGQLLFAEHGAAPDPGLRRWQDRITPYWKRIAGGCHLNRPIATLVERGGFRIKEGWQGFVRAPRLLGYFYTGVAVPLQA